MTIDTSNDVRVQEMENVNAVQKKYYEAEAGDLRHQGNLVTRSWTAVRDRVSQYRNEIGVKRDLRSLQYSWFGDLAGCRVMELGWHRAMRFRDTSLSTPIRTWVWT